MYCPNCGAEVPEGVKFCPNCGSFVEPPKPADPEPPKAPVCEAQKAPEKKRRVWLGALLFAALAIGPFLNGSLTGVRTLVAMIVHPADPTGFYRSAPFFSSVLLFLAALFLIICLVRQIPNGKRPVLGGVALLFVSLTSAYCVFSYLVIGGRLLGRWPTIGLLIGYAVCMILFLICAIFAFANKRFAVLGLIAALVYLPTSELVLFNSLTSFFRHPEVLSVELFNTILPNFAANLCHIFFGIAIMIFSLKFRPAKE
jgi:hypothetical protein